MQLQFLQFSKVRFFLSFCTNFRNILSLCLILLLGLSGLYCARFRVQELNALPRFSLDLLPAQARNPDMKLQLLEKEGLAYNFPVRPGPSQLKDLFVRCKP